MPPTPADGSSQHDSQVDSYGQISTHTEDTQMGGSRPWWLKFLILFLRQYWEKWLFIPVKKTNK